jgi:hypothetical protein
VRLQVQSREHQRSPARSMSWIRRIIGTMSALVAKPVGRVTFVEMLLVIEGATALGLVPIAPYGVVSYGSSSAHVRNWHP